MQQKANNILLSSSEKSIKNSQFSESDLQFHLSYFVLNREHKPIRSKIIHLFGKRLHFFGIVLAYYVLNENQTKPVKTLSLKVHRFMATGG